MRIYSAIFAAVCLAAASATHAQTRVINFNDVPSGTVVNTTYAGVTFTGQGGPFFTPVQVTDLETPTNALDATLSPVLMTFSSSAYGAGVRNLSLDVFGTFDFRGLPYGSTSAPIVFTDIFGNRSTFIVNETSSTGFHFSGGPSAIRSVLLPADAYFDNFTFQAVPEPSAWLVLTVGAAGVFVTAAARRRRSAG